MERKIQKIGAVSAAKAAPICGSVSRGGPRGRFMYTQKKGSAEEEGKTILVLAIFGALFGRPSHRRPSSGMMDTSSLTDA